jgi:hypothetical protein
MTAERETWAMDELMPADFADTLHHIFNVLNFWRRVD